MTDATATPDAPPADTSSASMADTTGAVVAPASEKPASTSPGEESSVVVTESAPSDDVPPAPEEDAPPPPPDGVDDQPEKKTWTRLEKKTFQGEKELKKLAPEKVEEFKEHFQTFSTDSAMTFEHFRLLFAHLQAPSSEALLMSFFQQVDTDKDGKISLDEFLIIMETREPRQELRKRKAMLAFVEKFGPKGLPSSRLKILPTDGTIHSVLDTHDWKNTVVGFDFDQTLSLSRRVSASRTSSVRGGDFTVAALKKFQELGVPLCVITAQQPTIKTLYNLTRELRELKLDHFFDVEPFNANPVWDLFKSWGEDEKMDLRKLTLKLLGLIVLNTDRYPVDVARIGHSTTKFEFKEGATKQDRESVARVLYQLAQPLKEGRSWSAVQRLETFATAKGGITPFSTTPRSSPTIITSSPTASTPTASSFPTSASPTSISPTTSAGTTTPTHGSTLAATTPTSPPESSATSTIASSPSGTTTLTINTIPATAPTSPSGDGSSSTPTKPEASSPTSTDGGLSPKHGDDVTLTPRPMGILSPALSPRIDDTPYSHVCGHHLSRDDELDPVKCWFVYQQRTEGLRPKLEEDDTKIDCVQRQDSPNRLLLNLDKPGTCYTQAELEELMKEILREAKTPEESWHIVLRELAEEHDYEDGIRLASMRSILASRYNKPEALEFFLQKKGLSPSTLVFVDDNSDNAFNVFCHFAKKRMADTTQPSIHCYWHTPVDAMEQHNDQALYFMRHIDVAYEKHKE